MSVRPDVMTRWFGIVFLCLLLVAGGSPLFAQAPGVSIKGTVTDRGGLPLGGVEVVIESPAQTSTVRTDTSGHFSTASQVGVAPTLIFTLAGYRSTTMTLQPSDADQELSIVLLSTAYAILSERILVVGQAGASRIPGSAHFLDNLAERNIPYDDVHQALREVPGVNIQEEDGFGLRPNIGMRGTGSERSSKITLMEDGVLIAPAPYAAPAAYYFPSIGRMRAIEVRKGSSQVKFGPRTNGGVLNLVSRDIPSRFQIDGAVAGGSHSTGKLDLRAGDSRDRFGWMVETHQVTTDGFKRLDSGQDTGFHVGDYFAKFRVNSDLSASVYQQLEFKIGKTTQRSDETYLGLTDDDFENDSLRRYQGSQVDRFDSDHEQYQLTYLIAPSDRFDITTSVYRNNFHRNWFKLQSVLGTGISKVFDDLEDFDQELAILKGADSQSDALKVRANNRTYYSQGIQSVVGLRLGDWNQLEVGFRYHADQEDRFQHEDGFQMLDGRMVATSLGAPGSQTNRVSDASALAFFASDTIDIGRWSLTPGVRLEHIRLTRTDYSTSDPDRSTAKRIRHNNLTVAIPGIGVRFDWRSDLSLFGGVHRGFSPPGPGSNEDTRPEESINYELGARWQPAGMEFGATGFFNNYSNLLGADTLSSGGTGEGDFFNGGRARAWGLEASGSLDLLRGSSSGFRIPVRFAYTFTRSIFLDAFDSDFAPWGSVVPGDRLPYIAPHQLFTSFSLEAHHWRVRLDSAYTSRMRTQAGQGPTDPFRSTDRLLTHHVSAEYDFVSEKHRATLFFTVQNLTDQRSIVARRPAGARPGLPRTFMLGLRFSLAP